jgi:hypothetical protein
LLHCEYYPAMSLIARLLWSQFFGVMAIFPAVADDGLFSGDDVLDVVLTGPVGKTAGDKRKTRERAFQIAIGDEDWPVDVRTRGKSRLVYCSFPPLRLNFAEGEITSGPFVGLDKVKLVTQCGDSTKSREDLLEEYAAYRMLNEVTALSHRVRLLQVRYVDSDKPRRDPVVQYAFAIEPAEHVARRNGAEAVPVRNVVVSRVNRDQAARVFVFQYLIANTDWSLVRGEREEECCHNMNILTADGEQLPIPYDFDLSGLVNARYARRTPDRRRSSVRDREYAGYCLGGLDLVGALAVFSDRREPIMAVLDELEWNNASEAQRRIEFLEEFFAEVAEPGFADRLAKDCVGK